MEYFIFLQILPLTQNEEVDQDDKHLRARTRIFAMEKRAQLEYLKKIMGMQPSEPERFEAAEHQDLADNVKLKFYGRGRDPILVNANEKLLTFIQIKCHDHNTRSAHGLSITFGKIAALAGDFYGIPDQPITLEEETELFQISDARKQRAKAAFNTIGEWKEEDFMKLKEELIKNLKFLEEERCFVEQDGRKKSSDISGVISYHGFEDVIKEAYDENSNKHIAYYAMKNGKHAAHLKKLLANNFDHFQPYAKVVYEVFHALALEEAFKARTGRLTPDEKNRILEHAYALEAFGSHFLGDSFASGHMRTPRRKLPQSTCLETYGHCLSNKMHDEDNEYGLRVTSKVAKREGHPSWIAHGDKMLHHTKNSANFKFAQRAVQLGVDEVFQASQKGKPEMKIDNSKVFDFIPYIAPSDENNTPMFQIRAHDGKVCRRKELNNLQCRKEPIDNWTTVGTVAILDQSQRINAVTHTGEKQKID